MAVLFAGGIPARADGLVRDGNGAVAVGRAGTNIAHSDNGPVLLDNPAALVNTPSRGTLDVGIDTLVTDIDYRDPDPNDVEASDVFTVPLVTYMHRTSDGRFAAGIGVYSPAGFAAEYRMLSPIFGRQDYESLGTLTKIIPGVAWKATEKLSVGATLGVGVSHVELRGPMFLQTGPLAGTPALFDLEADGAALVWSAGLQYKLTPQTTIGLAYTSQTDLTVEGDLDAGIVAGMGPLGPIILPSSFDAEMTLTWPRSLGLGVVHQINCRHRVSADVVWYDWSDAFDSMKLKLTDPSNPLIAALAGGTIRDRLPLRWRDSVSLRFGYEWFPTCCDVLRAGYAWHPRGVPDSTLNPYIDGTLEHVFAVGYGRRFNKWEINVAYQFNFGIERSVTSSRLAGGDFAASHFQAQAHWATISFIRRL